MRSYVLIFVVLVVSACCQARADQLADRLWEYSRKEHTPINQYTGQLHFLEIHLAENGIVIGQTKQADLTVKQVKALSDIRAMLAVTEEEFWKYGVEHPSMFSPKELKLWASVNKRRMTMGAPQNDIDFIKSRYQDRAWFEAEHEVKRIPKTSVSFGSYSQMDGTSVQPREEQNFNTK